MMTPFPPAPLWYGRCAEGEFALDLGRDKGTAIATLDDDGALIAIRYLNSKGAPIEQAKEPK